MTDLAEIAVEELARRLDDGEAVCVLDVREPWEVATARLEGALEIPMATIPGRLDAIPRDRPIVVMCHHGVRSAHVARWLLAQGLDGVVNLAGGIDAWSLRVDPETPRY